MKQGKNFWVPDKIEQLVALRNEALSCSQIGKRLSDHTHIVTRNSIIAKLNRLHMPSLYYGKGRPITTLPKEPKPPPLHKPVSLAHRWPIAVKFNPKAVQPPKNPEGPERRAHGHGKPITKLNKHQRHQCLFPTGYNKAKQHLFCGAATDGGSWCSQHRDRVFMKRGVSG